MKLPRSNYSRASVPSFGRHDINAPLRVAGAQARAAQTKVSVANQNAANAGRVNNARTNAQNVINRERQKEGDRQYRMSESDRQHKEATRAAQINLVTSLASTGVQAYGQYKKIEEAKNQAEAADIVNKYKTAAGGLTTELESDQFRQDESGVIRDNGDRILSGYQNGSDSLKNIHLEEIEDPRVKEIVMSEIEKIDMDNQTSIGKTSVAWALQTAEIKNETAMNSALEQGDIALAKRIFVSGVDTGAIDPSKVVETAAKIQKLETIGGYEGVLDGLASPQDIAKLRDSVDTPIYGNLTDTQRKSLIGLANDKIEDYWMGYTKDVGKIGIQTAKDTVRELSQMPPEEMGLSSEKAHKTLIGSMKTVVNNAEFGVQKIKKAAEKEIDFQRANAGGFINPYDTKQMNDYDDFFEKNLQEFADPETGQVPAPFSQEWVAAAGKTIGDRTTIPKEIKNIIRGYQHHGNPQEVAKAAAFVQTLKQVNPVGVEAMGLDAKTEALYTDVANAAKYGTPADDFVQKSRDTIYKNDPLTIETRQSQLKEFVGSEEWTEMLDDKIDDMGGDWENLLQQNIELGDLARGEFEWIYRQEFMESGSAEGAADRAWRKVTTYWTPSDRTGQLENQSSPESVYKGQLPSSEIEWETKRVLNQLGVKEDVSDVKLVPSGIGKNGEPTWAMYVEGEDLDRRGFLRNQDGSQTRISFHYPDTRYGASKIKEIENARKKNIDRIERRQERRKILMEQGDDQIGAAKVMEQLDQGHMFLSPERMLERANELQNGTSGPQVGVKLPGSEMTPDYVIRKADEFLNQ